MDTLQINIRNNLFDTTLYALNATVVQGNVGVGTCPVVTTLEGGNVLDVTTKAIFRAFCLLVVVEDSLLSSVSAR